MRICAYCYNKLSYKENAYTIHKRNGQKINYPGSWCSTCNKLIPIGCPGFIEYQEAVDRERSEFERELLNFFQPSDEIEPFCDCSGCCSDHCEICD